jgi:hypothetical protein
VRSAEPSRSVPGLEHGRGSARPGLAGEQAARARTGEPRRARAEAVGWGLPPTAMALWLPPLFWPVTRPGLGGSVPARRSPERWPRLAGTNRSSGSGPRLSRRRALPHGLGSRARSCCWKGRFALLGHRPARDASSALTARPVREGEEGWGPWTCHPAGGIARTLQIPSGPTRPPPIPACALVAPSREGCPSLQGGGPASADTPELQALTSGHAAMRAGAPSALACHIDTAHGLPSSRHLKRHSNYPVPNR